MLRTVVSTLAVFVLAGTAASAQQWTMAYPSSPPPRMVMAAPPPPPMRNELGGGFLEYLFGAHGGRRPVAMAPAPRTYGLDRRPRYAAPPPQYASVPPREQRQIEPMPRQQASGFHLDPRYLPQEVAYNGKEAPGTIVVNTPQHFLYLVQADGRARRYGIGVARRGFAWSGVHKITAKREWPDWIPPKDMLARQPYLPRRMPGGPNNPLGARALYIGHTLYRIHGSNEPWTIGHDVSSGCIRMANQEVVDLYKRVKVGTKVVIIGPHGSHRDYIPPPNTNPNDVERAADAAPPSRW